MSIKIIDSDSAINLLERQTAVDCTRFFSEYRVIVTEQVIEETSIGQLTAGCVFERYALDDDELELYERINDSIMELGPGERSAIAHALFMSNDGGDERIIIISDDKKAKHTFERIMIRMESIVERFPHLDRITWVRSFEVLKRMMDKGLLDETSASGMYDQLSPVLGPKKIGFLRMRNGDRGTSVSTVPADTPWHRPSPSGDRTPIPRPVSGG